MIVHSNLHNLRHKNMDHFTVQFIKILYTAVFYLVPNNVNYRTDVQLVILSRMLMSNSKVNATVMNVTNVVVTSDNETIMTMKPSISYPDVVRTQIPPVDIQPPRTAGRYSLCCRIGNSIRVTIVFHAAAVSNVHADSALLWLSIVQTALLYILLILESII